jgi:hypothetical protein
MTFTILGDTTVANTSVESFDTEGAQTCVIYGITDGAIVDLHTCVEYANEYSNAPVNGDDIEGIFKRVVAALRSELALLDEFAKNTNNVWSTEFLLANEDGMFNMIDLIEFKIEQYGSEEAWLTALRFNAEA